MSIEQAINRAKLILDEGNSELLEENDPVNLEEVLEEIDAEEGFDIVTPPPKQFLVGSYLGREEVLAEIPCVTVEARNTPEGETESGYYIKQHSFWVYAWVAEVDIEIMHRYMMRYAEGLGKIISDIRRWGNNWFDAGVNNTMYTDVFQADHRMVQGCRVEARVSEVFEDTV